jgi:hypothetical protein
MPLTARSLLVVKDGNPPEHNDDSAAADPTRGRFAISDGATEGGFSRIWSRLLVDQFIHSTDARPDDWAKWLPAAQQRWLAELQAIDIPWYGEQQFEQGSFATFLGLVVREPNESGCSWQAVAVGDSCLFQTRAGKLLQAFPLDKSQQFNTTPKLVGSRSSLAEIADKRSALAEGTAEPHDHLWLISDALAHWCLARTEAGNPPWNELSSLLSSSNSDAAFHEWINQLRTTGGLHNDDVTLLGIELGGER